MNTPLTDAQEYYIDGQYHISAELGRKLERDLTMARSENARLKAIAVDADGVEWRVKARLWSAKLEEFMPACPANPTEEQRQQCQHWWATHGRTP